MTISLQQRPSNNLLIHTWADVLNRAGLGIEVIHKRNVHNFPLDLAAPSIRS